MSKSSCHYPRQILLILGISMICSGCCLFQSAEERIPERKAFSGSFIKQSSFAELKKSYTEHYCLVLDELSRLEKCYQSSREKPDWLTQKIEDHKKYLADMANYPFLCPSHDVVSTVSGEKTCPTCNGKGKNFWGNTCAACSGKGKISFSSSQNKKCPYCNQLYRGSILGRSLYENK